MAGTRGAGTGGPSDGPASSQIRCSILRPVVAAWPALVVAGLVLIVVGLVGAAPAGAHASLQSTDPVADLIIPTGPDQVVLTFDEAVSAELGGGVRVVGPDGNRVDRSVVRFEDGDRRVVADVDADAPGTYTVAWQVVSEDSHVLSGSFVFHVQVETGSAALDEGGGRRGLDVVAWAARWLVLTGATVLAGLAVLRLVVRPPGGLVSPRAHRYALVAAAGLVTGAAVRLVAQVAAASGRSLAGALGLVAEAVTDTRAGRLDGLRLLAALVALLGAAAWRRGRGAAFVVLGAAAGVMVVNSLAGHAFTSDRPSLAVLNDLVHQYGVAVWVGGLAAVAVLSRSADGDGETRVVLRTFSRLAVGGLVVVAATGVVSAWVQVGDLGALRSTTYGRVLVAKVGLVVVMALFGWWNRGRLREIGERVVELLATVRAEAVLGVAVLALTAALVALVPAREQLSEPFSATRSDGAGLVTMTLSPARPGANSLHLYFFDDAGRPRAVDAAEARVQLGDLPARKVDLLPVLPDHYAATGFSLPQPGRWRVTITSLARGVPSESIFEVPVR